MKQKGVIEFWSHFLEDVSLPWKQELKALVQSALVMPIGSADAEKGFAIMNNIRTSKRSSLEHGVIDAIMRIKINGPSIPDFNAKKYALRWVQQGGFLSDDQRERGKQKRTTDDKIYLAASKLF